MATKSSFYEVCGGYVLPNGHKYIGPHVEVDQRDMVHVGNTTMRLTEARRAGLIGSSDDGPGLHPHSGGKGVGYTQDPLC